MWRDYGGKLEMAISEETAVKLAEQFGTPLYVYSSSKIQAQVATMQSIPSPFGLTVRYAVKALSTRAILQLISQFGLSFVCSSDSEVFRVAAAGIPGSRISLVSQQFPEDAVRVVELGAAILPTSLYQLRRYGSDPRLPRTIGIRVNPGLGSGSSHKTNVGGPSSSFGIWHENIPEVLSICAEFNLTVEKIHTHIGSGSDPLIWMRVAELTLGIAEHFPEAHTVSLGGGFKVARVQGETECDVVAAGAFAAAKFQDFFERTGRKLHMEVEPGTFLVANAGCLLATVIDKCATPSFRFLKINSGMTEIMRPTLYNSQHPISIIPRRDQPESYVVVGHCCESGDLLTPSPHDLTELLPRALSRAEIGDLCLIGGVGAYCSSMSAKNYNSYPEAAEVLLTPFPVLIRQRQTLAQLTENELSLP